MCFSLPTPEDPFNDRYNNKKKKEKENPKRNPNPRPKPKINPLPPKTEPDPGKESAKRPKLSQKAKKAVPSSNGDGNFEDGCFSKFLTMCLNAIQNAWKEEEEDDEDDEGNDISVSNGCMNPRRLLASSWGADLWRCCYCGWNVVDSSGACASKEQLAWLLSTASDIIARKEKQGQVIASPFLLHLVPSQEKAVQVSRLLRLLLNCKYSSHFVSLLI